MRRNRLPVRDDRFQAALISFFFAVGAAGHVLMPEWMEHLTPPVLWVFGLLTVWGSARSMKRYKGRFLLWVLLTYLITFVLEAAGTATGAIFGPYTYGTVLGLSVFSVPLVIGFNWVLVVLGALRMTRRLPGWAAVLTAAALTTGFDVLMEPAAIRLEYWTWNYPGIPVQNYLAWFVISAAAAMAFRGLNLRINSRIAAYYLCIQTGFFAALRIVLPAI